MLKVDGIPIDAGVRTAGSRRSPRHAVQPPRGAHGVPHERGGPDRPGHRGRRRHDGARRPDAGRRAALRDDRRGGRGDVRGLGRRVGAVVARTPGTRLPPRCAGAVPPRLPGVGTDARRPLSGRAGTQRRRSSARSVRRCAITPSSASCWICGTTGEARPAGSASSSRFLVDQHVPLVVLVGRLTFSAGSTLALHLERRVPDAVFIGETMGGAPAFWADPDTVTLPYSGLVALVDSRFNPSPVPGDDSPRGPTGHRGPVHLGRLLRGTRSGPGASAGLTSRRGRLPRGPVVATIRSMKTSRRLLVVLAGACVFIVSTVATAVAQTPVDPSTTPVENTGGWVFSMAQLLTLLGVATVLFLIVMYMRYAPRFAKDEEGLKVVRADRVRPGHALPRRDVDISQAAPVVVAPPAVPVAVGAPAPAAAPVRSRGPRSTRRRRTRPPQPRRRRTRRVKRRGRRTRRRAARAAPPLRQLPPSASRSRWTRRSSTRSSPNCSRRGPTAAWPRARRGEPP